MYCNHCGANNPDGATYCNACGKPISATGTLHIEKPATKHNLAELETRSQWCDFLSRFRNHVLQVNDCYDQIERICAKIAVYQAEKTELKNTLANDTAFRKSKKVLIGFLIFVSLEIIPSILRFGPGYQDGPADDLKAGAAILAIPLLVFLLLFNRRKHWQREIRLRDENTDLQVKKAIKEKLKLQINFEKFNENKINGVYIIGFDYSSPWMLKALEDVIRDGKADNPKEAIACYEAELERRRSQQDRERNALFQQTLLDHMNELHDQMNLLNSLTSANFVLNGARL